MPRSEWSTEHLLSWDELLLIAEIAEDLGILPLSRKWFFHDCQLYRASVCLKDTRDLSALGSGDSCSSSGKWNPVLKSLVLFSRFFFPYWDEKSKSRQISQIWNMVIGSFAVCIFAAQKMEGFMPVVKLSLYIYIHTPWDIHLPIYLPSFKNHLHHPIQSSKLCHLIQRRLIKMIRRLQNMTYQETEQIIV